MNGQNKSQGVFIFDNKGLRKFVILRLWNYVHRPNFPLLIPLPSIFQVVTLLFIPELPRLLNPYLKNTVVNKTNHMTEEDESILEKEFG
ncbi:hypothetical protein Bca4012_065868 [Brassica carinata]